MTVSVTHRFVSPVADAGNPDELGPNEWNDTHVITGLENVDNTSDANKPISTATQAALDLKADAADLTNVDNTSDANKPVSTAQQTALDLKANIASPTFTGTVDGITKSMVGLGNVDNTTDAGKPVSTATQTALDLKSNLSSPTFTGTPAAPTATADTSTTQLATTAYVVGQAASVAPLVEGTAAIGTSLKYARQDHVHPQDKFTQTGTGAVAVGPYIGIQDRVFTPEQFGAVGDGSTDDTSAIAAAMTAAKAASSTYGNAKVLFQRRYKTTDSIALFSWSGTIELEFTAGAGFNLTTSSTTTALVIGTGSLTATSTTLTANVAAGSPLATVTSTASLAAGDYVLVLGSTGVGTYIHQQINRIKSVVDSTNLEFDHVTEFPITVATNLPSGYVSTTPYVQKITMETGRLVMKGGVFEGASATGVSTTGALLQFLVRPHIERVQASNFVSAGSTGFAIQYIYGGRIKSLLDLGSGDAVTNSSASINCASMTGVDLDDVVSANSAGFGILIDYMNGCRQSNFEAYGSAGRGIKHWGCCGNLQANLKADHNAYTGIDYDSVCYGNRASNWSASYNRSGEGILFIGTGSTNNVIVGAIARQNSSSDIALGASVAADSDNTIIGANDDAVILVSGVTNVAIYPASKSIVKVTCSGNTSTTSGTAATVAFDTKIMDPCNQFDTGTGVLTIKNPGWYDVDIELAFGSIIDLTSQSHVFTGGTVADSNFFSGGSAQVFHYRRTLYLAQGTTLRPQVTQNSGGAALVAGSSSFFTVTQL